MFESEKSMEPEPEGSHSASDGERADGRAAENAPRPQFTCLICGAAMLGVQCKLICPNCGYREDCSDLFRVE